MKSPVPGVEPACRDHGSVGHLWMVALIAMTGSVQAIGQQQSPFSAEDIRILAVCRERLTLVPTHRYYFSKMVGIHRRRGALPRLLSQYAGADDPVSQLVTARLLTELGRAREAQQQLEALLTNKRWRGDVHLLLARLKARRLDPQGALAHYKQVLANPRFRGREKIQLAAAGQAMQARRTDEALALVRQIKTAHTREVFYRQHGMIAALIASLQTRWKAARYPAERLSFSAQLVGLAANAARLATCARHAAYILDQTAPGHWTRRQLFDTLERLGRSGLAGQLEPVLRRALLRRPRDTDLRAVTARLAVRQGQVARAIKILRQGIALSPSGATLRLTLADLLMRQGKMAEAQTLLLAAQKEDPRILLRRLRLVLETDPTAVSEVVDLLIRSPQSRLTTLLEAESLLRRMGRTPSARRLLRAATRRWPQDHRPLIELARMDERSGNKPRAVAWARKVCHLRSFSGRRAGVRLLARCGRATEAFALLNGWSVAAGGAIYLELASELAREAGDRQREQRFLLSRYRDARPDWLPQLASRIAALGPVSAAQTRPLSADRKDWLQAYRLLEQAELEAGLRQMTDLAQLGPPAQLLSLARQARRFKRNQLARDAYGAYLQTGPGLADRQAALELSALMMINGDARTLSRWFAKLLRRFPDETQIYLLQADLALRNDDWPEALELLGRGLVACGEQSRLLLALAQIQKSLGQRKQAAALYHRLAVASQGDYRRKAIHALLELSVPRTASDPISLEVQVRQQMRRGNQEQALVMVRASVRRYPNQLQLLRLQGELQLATGQGDQSAQLLRRVLLLNKRPDPALARLLARSLALAGKTGEARRMVDRMGTRRPLARARAYMSCGLFKAAIEELETLKKQRGSSPSLAQLLLVAYLADGRDAQGQKIETPR